MLLTLQVNAVALDGSHESATVQVDPQDAVASLRTSRVGDDWNAIYLFHGRRLDPSEAIGRCGLSDGDTVHVVQRLVGARSTSADTARRLQGQHLFEALDAHLASLDTTLRSYRDHDGHHLSEALDGRSASLDHRNDESPNNASVAHPHVRCDGCMVCPIVGTRFKSVTRPNYDLCAVCHQGGRYRGAGPFTAILTPLIEAVTVADRRRSRAEAQQALARGIGSVAARNPGAGLPAETSRPGWPGPTGEEAVALSGVAVADLLARAAGLLESGLAPLLRESAASLRAHGEQGIGHPEALYAAQASSLRANSALHAAGAVALDLARACQALSASFEGRGLDGRPQSPINMEPSADAVAAAVPRFLGGSGVLPYGVRAMPGAQGGVAAAGFGLGNGMPVSVRVAGGPLPVPLGAFPLPESILWNEFFGPFPGRPGEGGQRGEGERQPPPSHPQS